jgi:hypothetical protein
MGAAGPLGALAGQNVQKECVEDLEKQGFKLVDK